MKRRTVFALCAVLTVTLAGAVAARQYFYNPYADLPARNGLNWRGSVAFRGEVRFYDVYRLPHGTISSSMEEDRPPVAWVEIGGNRFDLRGAGRHQLRAPDGTLYGYADLIPQTKAEREDWWTQHDTRMGIEEPLRISHGAKDGFGIVTGFFGEGENRVDWRFYGVGKIIFRNPVTGKVVYTAQALPLTPEIREEQRRNLSPEDFAATVAERVPEVGQFNYRIGGRERMLFTPRPHAIFPLPLPNGLPIQVEVILPDGQDAITRFQRRYEENMRKKGAWPPEEPKGILDALKSLR